MNSHVTNLKSWFVPLPGRLWNCQGTNSSASNARAMAAAAMSAFTLAAQCWQCRETVENTGKNPQKTHGKHSLNGRFDTKFAGFVATNESWEIRWVKLLVPARVGYPKTPSNWAHPHPWDMLGLQTATNGKRRATKQKQVHGETLPSSWKKMCVTFITSIINQYFYSQPLSTTIKPLLSHYPPLLTHGGTHSQRPTKSGCPAPCHAAFRKFPSSSAATVATTGTKLGRWSSVENEGFTHI